MSEIHEEGDSYDAGDDGPVEVTEEEAERLRGEALRRWDEAVARRSRRFG